MCRPFFSAGSCVCFVCCVPAGSVRCTESRLPLCWGSCEHLPPLHYPHTHFHTHTHTHSHTHFHTHTHTRTHIFTHTHYRFRQEEPEDLVAMQKREWDPVVNWFNHRYIQYSHPHAHYTTTRCEYSVSVETEDYSRDCCTRHVFSGRAQCTESM